jgi:hypothetical protein
MKMLTVTDVIERTALTVRGLTDEVLAGARGEPPGDLVATSVFWFTHGTRLAGSATTYRNHYVLVRVGRAFGAASVPAGTLEPAECHDASGSPLDVLLRDGREPLRTAALDAYLAAGLPFRDDPAPERVMLPDGTPEQRAVARDAAVAGLLDVPAGAGVALIGVVNPLVAAIRERGAECLPCDLDLRTTQWGDPVARDAAEVIDAADAVVATGMTLANGTFDEIVARCRDRGVPLTVYAQTGAAVARAFLASGVDALSAEPFPFSQCSAEPTVVYRYRS